MVQAQLLAKAFQVAGYTVLVVTHDGENVPVKCIACTPHAMNEILLWQVQHSFEQGLFGKVILIIDAQPVFFEGKAHRPIKPDVVNYLVSVIQKEYAHTALSAVYVYE